MATKQQIEQGLKDIGACWAIRSDKFIDPSDGYDAAPTYHVHPNAAYPHQDNIRAFKSLRELWSYIQACKQSDALHAADGQFHEVVYTGDGYEVS